MILSSTVDSRTQGAIHEYYLPQYTDKGGVRQGTAPFHAGS
jgi:hypothetical protein